MLLLRDGPLQAGEVGRRLSLQKTTAWRLVNGLAEQGLVKRAENLAVADKRMRTVVQLEPDGEDCIQAFAAKL